MTSLFFIFHEGYLMMIICMFVCTLDVASRQRRGDDVLVNAWLCIYKSVRIPW